MSGLLNYILKHEDAFRNVGNKCKTNRKNRTLNFFNIRNRLPSLYSDFTLQKKTNPDGYAVNVAAWEHALTRAAKAGCVPSHAPGHVESKSIGSSKSQSSNSGTWIASDHLVLRVDSSLLRELEIPEYGQPVALAAVFDEAIKKHTMIPLQTYKTDAGSLQRRNWSIIDPASLSPYNIMSWSMKQLRGFVIGSDTFDSLPHLQIQELVLVHNLQEAASQVTAQASSRGSSMPDRIYSKESFMAEFASALDQSTRLSSTDFDVLLLYLSRDSGAIAYDGQTIKFRSPSDGPAITQQDTTIASMKMLISTISKQVENLEGKVAELTFTAKAALNNKNRISALSALRSKKLAEHNLKQRLDTLAQLEETYNAIDRASGQVEIVQAMEAGASVLKALHTEIGGAERVENVVEDLRDEMSKVDELGIRNGVNEAEPAVDETEVDGELEAMEEEERQAREEEEVQETVRRLADLDKAAAEAGRKTEDQAVESDLAESVGKLSEMSIEEGTEAGAGSVANDRPLPGK